MVTFPAVMLPLGTSIQMLLLAVICYGVAVSLDHVLPVWPYISDLGVLYPERCITSFLSSFVAIFGFPFAFLRYKYILHFEKKGASVKKYIKTMARVSAVCTCLAMLGVLFNGSFQQYGVDRLHTVGGAMLFFFGGVSCILDSIITRQMDDKLVGKKFKIARICLCVLIPIFAVLCFVGKFVSEGQLIDRFPTQTVLEKMARQLRWDTTLPAYGLHLVGSINELLVLFVYFAFICSFVYEFKGLRVEVHIVN